MTKLSDTQQLTKVIVIGCGYVGKAVARYWYQQGYWVTGTTTRAENCQEIAKITHQTLVMTGNDPEAVANVLKDQDTVLVSIAPISDRQVDAEAYGNTYLPMAKNLVATLQNHSTVKQVIYLSSCSVYGNQKGNWVDETTPLDTENDYSKILVEAEQILLTEKPSETRICILRLGGIYGPRRELDKRIGRLSGKTMPGTGENWTSWIHLEDVVSAIEFVHQHRCQGIYNLVNDVKLTSKALCNLICDRQQLGRVSWDGSKPPFSAVNARVDNRKIKAAGYQLIYGDKLI